MSLAAQGLQLLRVRLPVSSFHRLDAGLVRIAPAGEEFVLKTNWLGACVAVASLLSGCIDPGPGPARATGSPSSTSRVATLSWEAPTANTDGTALTDLAGYRIYYGPSAENLSQSVQVNTTGLQTYVLDGLEPGTWYFALTAYTTTGVESGMSQVVSAAVN